MVERTVRTHGRDGQAKSGAFCATDRLHISLEALGPSAPMTRTPSFDAFITYTRHTEIISPPRSQEARKDSWPRRSRKQAKARQAGKRQVRRRQAHCRHCSPDGRGPGTHTAAVGRVLRHGACHYGAVRGGAGAAHAGGPAKADATPRPRENHHTHRLPARMPRHGGKLPGHARYGKDLEIRF